MFGLYVHWPFCKSKCPYCDFNSHVRARVDEARFRAALLAELDRTAELSGQRNLTSIFFGGGTPSLMSPETTGAVIERALALFPPADGQTPEITLEANPTSVEAERFRGFRDVGVNRVSLGVQALDDASLKALGRQHSVAEALGAVELAAATFPRFSFDLIYARPGQTPADWARELKQALSYAVGHISAYQLTIEPGTAFFTEHRLGRLVLPEEDTTSTLYDMTRDILAAEGLPAYEVSNHARPGEESRHNLVYWRYGDYAGIGAGAHGRLTRADGVKVATYRERLPEHWLEKVETCGDGLRESIEVSPAERAVEMAMMGLRLTEGLDLDRFRNETGLRFDEAFDRSRIEDLEGEGYLATQDGRIAVTREGMARLDALLKYLTG